MNKFVSITRVEVDFSKMFDCSLKNSIETIINVGWNTFLPFIAGSMTILTNNTWWVLGLFFPALFPLNFEFITKKKLWWFN